MLELVLILLLTSSAILVLLSKNKWRKIVSSRVFVRPTTMEAKTFVTNMRGVDTSFFMVPDVPVVWVFQHNKIKFEALKQALERTLNQIPIAAGRVVIGPDCLQISCVNSPGCLLQFHKRLNMECPNINLPASAYSPFGIVDPLIPTEPFSKPLVSATLTHFKTGCCLYMNFNHTLMDGFSMVKFMEIWSFETDKMFTHSREQLPPVDCDHSWKSSSSSKMTISECDLNRKLSVFSAIRFLLGIAYYYYSDALLDIDFTLDEWNALKERIQNKLLPGQWISSYEAIMGLSLNALSKIDQEDLEVRAIVNLRGRSSHFSPSYIGNGFGFHEFQISSQETLERTAYGLHTSLRNTLKNDLYHIEKHVLIPEQLETHRPGKLGRLFGSRLSLVERARYVVGWEKTILGNSVVINSWVGYSWLAVKFGTGKCADFMRVPPPMRSPREIFVSPVTETKFSLRVSLRAWEMKQFKQILRESGFTFQVKEEYNSFWLFPLFDGHFWTSNLAHVHDVFASRYAQVQSRLKVNVNIYN